MITRATHRRGAGIAALAALAAFAALLVSPTSSSQTAVDLSLVDAGFVPMQSVDGRISSSTTALVVNQELFSFSRGDFDVRAFGPEHTGEVAYIVQGKGFALQGSNPPCPTCIVTFSSARFSPRCDQFGRCATACSS